jgi:hypothetical protein
VVRVNHPFMDDSHCVFMRRRLDIMGLCIRTSCATAGMSFHKFNYQVVETYSLILSDIGEAAIRSVALSNQRI